MELDQTVRLARFAAGRWQSVEETVVREGMVRIHVNGQELAALMCTPCQLDLLALGFLCGENIIAGMADVRLVKVCPSDACVEVWLRDAEAALPRRPIITSGCGGGITFADLTARAQPLTSGLRVCPGQLHRLMRAMQQMQQTRGVHTAALAQDESLLVVVEDLGRHNTIDKLWGYCLAEGVTMEDKILLSTGRISSEMLNKAARMGVPVVASRTTPTSLSVALANAWNVTLVGYVRRDGLNVYAGQQRLAEDAEEQTDANS